MHRFTRIGSCIGAAALLWLGCTQQRPPRSFVQPNAIAKADLVGTWHYVQTVMDAPPTSNFLFIGNSSELMKIKFDIQENYLYARRSYEQIQGSEDAYSQDPSEYQGQPLGAWRIESQFDIIRQYNPTTGEETNQIVESQERPWDQRQFIRVDWSQNIITDYVGLGLNFFFQQGASTEPASYWESDPTSPDALHLEHADATDPDFAPGEANYLDITNEILVTPPQKTLCFEENGVQNCETIPSCFLAYQVEDCASQLVKVRHSFAKIAATHDYQPRNWDGLQMNQFGIWDVGLARLTYNRQYGITNTGIQRHAARFNLWANSHTTTTCTTDLDCGNTTGDANGAKCDLGIIGAPANGGICTIPYTQRQMRTIPYYAESSLDEYQNETLSPNTVLTPFPPELFDTGAQVIAQWNAAVKGAVKDVTGQIPTQDVFVWCHNPVKLVADTHGPADASACQANIKPQLDANGKVITDSAGNPIYKARQGDPRRSTIFWVNELQQAGPLGYGPPLFDPETGETISGQAYIFGAAMDTYAARSRDLVLLLLGKIDPTQYYTGTNVADWVKLTRTGVLNRDQTYSQNDVKQRFGAMNFAWARGAAPQAPVDTSSVAGLVNSLNNREAAIYQSGVFGAGNADMTQLRRNRLFDTPLEAMMITPDVLDMAGAQPGADWSSLDNGEKWRVSPLRSHVVTQAVTAQMDMMRTLGVDFDEFGDEGMVQRALQLAHDPTIPNLAPEVIYETLRKDIFLGLTLHEVGHNMGLRHNFRASYDAMNYFPEYWQLRQGAASNATAHKYVGIDPSSGQPLMTGTYGGTDCNDTTNPLHKGHVRPRYVDCPGGATSVEEVMGQTASGGTPLPGGVREFQYTSVMDYGAEFNSDLQGLGHYDKAAMKFSYAGDGYVEVFPNVKPLRASNNLTAEGNSWTSIDTFQSGYGAPSPLTTGVGLGAVTYPTYPDLFQNGLADLEVRADVPFSKIQDVGSPSDPTNPSNVTHLWVYNGPGGSQLPMVPYFFCSDEFVGNLTCQRFDSGADAFEQAEDIISRYTNFYMVNNFKRDRYTFHSSLAYQSRVEGRYLDILREQLTWYTLFRSDFEDYVFQLSTDPATGVSDPEKYLNNFFTAENGWGSFTVAVTSGFDLLGQIITTPEAGQFAQLPANITTDSTAGYYKQFTDSLLPVQGAIGVGLIGGKYSTTTWDFSGCGYYWADECETRVGYFRDKVMALDELSQSQAYFTGRDTSTDVRTYTIGYILPFKQQIQEKIGALLANDYNSLAPYIDTLSLNVVNNGWTLDNGGFTTPTGQLVYPTTGFTLQLYAGVYGLSSFPTTFDQSFIDTTKIFVVGNGESPVSDTLLASPDTPGSIATTQDSKLVANGGTAQYYIWNDLTSGKTYAALSVPSLPNNDGTAGKYRNDTGVRMLEMAAALDAQRAGFCANPNQVPGCEAKTLGVEQFRENIQVMRSLHNAYGYGVYKTDAPFYY